MLRYHRYIIGRLFWPTLLICFSLSCIAWLIRSLQYIDFIINKGVNAGTFFYLASLVFPSLLWVFVPVSVFIACLLVYQRMTADSELIILRSTGVTQWGLIKPVISFALMMTAFTYIIGSYLLPASYREFKDLQRYIRDNYVTLLLQESVFLSPQDGFTVYIRKREEGGALKGLLVQDDREAGNSMTYMAENGQLARSSKGPMIMLENGNRQQKNDKEGTFSLLYFDRYALDLNLFQKNKKTGERQREAQERYLGELFYPKDTTNIRFINKLRAEGHSRLTWPLYNLILALLAVIPFVNREFSRQQNNKIVLLTATSAVGLVILSFFLTNLISSHPHLSILSYISAISAIGLGLYLNTRQAKSWKKQPLPPRKRPAGAAS